jgi:redox-sensing transcriptional repressor
MKDNKQKSKDVSAVSPAVIRRLPRYFRYLSELKRQGISRVSSKELSDMMHITASQIRQDFNCFGGFGQQGYGYNVDYLDSQIRDILGVDRMYNAVIIGAGNLGHAIAGTPMFEKRGVTLRAMFDVDSAVIGQTIAGLNVLSMDELEKYCTENDIDIAVLTLPRAAARSVAEKLVSMGIKGIWNFTNVELELTGSKTQVQNVHMGDTLMVLCYDIKRANSDNSENNN